MKEYFKCNRYNKSAIPISLLSKYDYTEKTQAKLKTEPKIGALIPGTENEETYFTKVGSEVIKKYIS